SRQNDDLQLRRVPPLAHDRDRKLIPDCACADGHRRAPPLGSHPFDLSFSELFCADLRGSKRLRQKWSGIRACDTGLSSVLAAPVRRFAANVEPETSSFCASTVRGKRDCYLEIAL